MLGTIKKLFSADRVVDAAIAGADKAFFTNEEKSDKFSLFLKLYEPFKIAQRFLAMTFCPPYMLMIFITWFASFFTDVTQQAALLKGDIAVIVGVIMAFYFGGGFVEGIIGRAKTK